MHRRAHHSTGACKIVFISHHASFALRNVIIMIPTFRALAVPYLSENFVMHRVWEELRKLQIYNKGVLAMAKRTFAYGCSLASLTAILVASVSLPSLAPA